MNTDGRALVEHLISVADFGALKLMKCDILLRLNLLTPVNGASFSL
jgi:hypothetical protein